MKLNNIEIQNIYMLGIGGVGMGALAQYFLYYGCQVYGYDRAHSEICEILENKGAKIHYQSNINLIPNDVDIVIYTPAIPFDFDELQIIKNRNLPIYKRSDILAMITPQLETYAVAGSHGKSTITAMLSHIWSTANRDFIAMVGALVKDYENNFIINGEPKEFIVEADEYDKTFLKFTVDTGIITSIEPDHLDIYKNFDALKDAFREFVNKIKNEIWIDENVNLQTDKNINTYGLSNKSDIYAYNIRLEDGKFVFDIYSNYHHVKIENLKLNIAGMHNIRNATAAIAIALSKNINIDQIKKAINTYPGLKRRLDLIYNGKSKKYYDDYAHHPTEIDTLFDTLKTLYPDKTFCAIFQPHLYSRTSYLADAFATSLSKWDRIILLDIYPAREKPIDGITSEWLLSKINNNNKYLMSKDELLTNLNNISEDILVTIGAGDIESLREPIKNKLMEYET
ncbi:MAG: UDP-N-acetylmuramate--alanine ligase [Rikenellaceae bacterium]|nr:UDP-N-acetylmuramate--alanine ligase [Rikenellaceae bacterium]